MVNIPLFVTQAATCFDTYVPCSGSVLYPCELLKARNGCVIGLYRCTVNVGVHVCAQLDKVTHQTTTFTVQGYIPMTQPFQTFSNS
jgi:hypothetical protein